MLVMPLDVFLRLGPNNYCKWQCLKVAACSLQYLIQQHSCYRTLPLVTCHPDCDLFEKALDIIACRDFESSYMESNSRVIQCVI